MILDVANPTIIEDGEGISIIIVIGVIILLLLIGLIIFLIKKGKGFNEKN